MGTVDNSFGIIHPLYRNSRGEVGLLDLLRSAMGKVEVEGRVRIVPLRELESL